MVLRLPRARRSARDQNPRRPQLIFANILLHVEQAFVIFLRPILLAVFFTALASLGAFSLLFPWAHLIALILFVVLFFDSLGHAQISWRSIPSSYAKRRLEDTNNLRHRPLDVLEDHPAEPSDEQRILWQAHKEQAAKTVENLAWPRWNVDMRGQDPYRLRFVALVLLMVGIVSGWGVLGGRWMASINPALGNWHLVTPALDAWITPPEYTHLSPIMIVTPAGSRHDRDVIEVPSGSVLSAHLAEREGIVPTLGANDSHVPFAAENNKDFAISIPLTSGSEITIHRGWQTLGSWKIHIVDDAAPRIVFLEPPSVSERKAVRLAFEATDDYGVSSVRLRVTPRETLAGASSDPIEVSLATTESKDVKRTAFEDLTSHPWAGLPVNLQLIVADATGHEGVSDVVPFTLPERVFLNPVARALIEERKKLLETPTDDSVRNEVANVMASVAHQPQSYRSDPVVLMSLRAGAVRLVLDHSAEATSSVDDILWQVAVQIEDGNAGDAEQVLREAQKDVADALDSHADQADLQKAIDRLHLALAQYLAQLSARMAQQPGPTEDLSQLMGQQNNALSPDDLDHMLDQMRSLSATGSRDAAREELSKLQQMLESLRTGPIELTAEQREALHKLKDLRGLAQEEQKLIDKTFQTSPSDAKTADKTLANEQNALLDRLRGLMGDAKDNNSPLAHSADAMQRAGSDLMSDAGHQALAHENEALKALQEAANQMQQDLREGLLMMPRPGMGMAGRDPFGRGYNGFAHDDGSVKVPDQMQVRHVREILDELQRRAGDMNRPKDERDYIDRLLQNF